MRQGNVPQRVNSRQCENLVKDYGFIHLSTGDLLREEEHKNGELGQGIKQTIKAGTIGT